MAGYASCCHLAVSNKKKKADVANFDCLFGHGHLVKMSFVDAADAVLFLKCSPASLRNQTVHGV